MNAVEWDTCTQPYRMLMQLEKLLPADRPRWRRKWILFNCACCRRLWPLLSPVNRKYVEAVERYADGAAKKKDIEPLRGEAMRELYWGYRGRASPRWYAMQSATTVT